MVKIILRRALTMEEYVVLVDERNHPIGTLEKLAAHNTHTPLHRGISVFVFDDKANLLLQQRSHKKKTWPMVWSNTCCGHPTLDETSIDTAKRRLAYELGMTNIQLTVMLPDYRYRFKRQGIVENEFCPVMIGITDQQPTINPDEVEAVKWLAWKDWCAEIENNPQGYSEWCVEETKLLSKDKNFQRFLEEATKKLPSK